MTWVDWIIVALMAGGVLAGISQGFLRSIFSLGGLILGLVLASWNYPRVAAFFKTVVHNQQVANAIGFVIIALLVTAIAAVMGIFLSKTFQKLGLGCLDRLAGALFGFFQGALLVTVCMLVMMAFFPDTEWLTQAKLPKYFFGVCHLSTNLTPKELAQRVRNELNRLERESPGWMHPEKRGG